MGIGVPLSVIGIVVVAVLVYRALSAQRVDGTASRGQPSPPRDERPPRPHHYRFAHVVLRDAALTEPERVWSSVTGGAANDFLLNLWAVAGHGLGGADVLGPEGIRVSVVDGPTGFRAAIVRLPAPERITEAHRVILVLPVADGAGSPLRYFVVERAAASEHGSPRAYLAEWRSDGTRTRLCRVGALGEGDSLVGIARQLRPGRAARHFAEAAKT